MQKQFVGGLSPPIKHYHHLLLTMEYLFLFCVQLLLNSLKKEDLRCSAVTSCCVLCARDGGMCQCGRAQDDHDSVATADAYGAAVTSKWNVVHHTSDYPTDAFGELEFIGTGRRHYPVSGGALYSHLHLVIFILSVLETCRFEEVVLGTFNSA